MSLGMRLAEIIDVELKLYCIYKWKNIGKNVINIIIIAIQPDVDTHLVTFTACRKYRADLYAAPFELN